MNAEIIVAEWAKNQRETLRIRLDTYQGRAIIDCRCWYDDRGTLKPGRAGLTISTRHLPQFAEALAKAAEIAAVSGLHLGNASQNE
jgi:hypothetical protein